MKFICNECKETKDIYKVKFTQKEKQLVCKDAYCCNSYMEQVKTDEYKGIPDIKRNEIKHSKQGQEEKLNNILKGE